MAGGRLCRVTGACASISLVLHSKRSCETQEKVHQRGKAAMASYSSK